MEKSGEAGFEPVPVIEPLRPGEIREISRALAAMDPWRTLGYKPQSLSYYLLRADCALKRRAIYVSGNLSGVLAVRFPWLFGPFIELIALFGDCRRKGIGRRVIEWTCGQYPASRNIWATVSAFNLDAQKFYARMGFERTAALEDLIKPGLQEILVRKRV